MTLKNLLKTIDGWKATAKVSSEAETSSGIPLPDLFLPREEDLSAVNYQKNIGFPGEYPFTRGVHPTMYRGRAWTMRQYAGYGTAEETNKRYRYLLSQGTTGLSVAFDLPTQMGRDSDHQLANGEVGRVGVAIDTIEDMAALFQGIPLEQVSTSMTINSTAHILLALYFEVAKRQGVSPEKLRGTVQNDVLKEYIARGTYIYPPKPALKIATDIFEYCREHAPNWNVISISGYHIREAGSTAVQELAFTLANGIAYVEAALKRGMDIDSFGPRLAFFFNCHNEFLEEIAKFRAARRLWARLMKERFSAKDPKTWALRFHTQTAGSSLTAQQPLVNIVRTTVQALAAVLGGTQSLHTNSYDEALGLPTEEAALLALRTQQVLACESGLTDVVDPFAGSYAIEYLTDEIEKRASELIQEIENSGGMVSAIEQGIPQRQIEEASYRYQQHIEKKTKQVVGVNSFLDTTSQASQRVGLKVNPRLEAEQLERLRAFKAARDPILVSQNLTALKRAAQEDRNLMPAVCEAVAHGVTVGEISDVLREVYSQYKP